MKLIDLLALGNRMKAIPKSEIPTLLAEIETLKARLWLRLTEWEEIEPVVVLARTAPYKHFYPGAQGKDGKMGGQGR